MRVRTPVALLLVVVLAAAVATTAARFDSSDRLGLSLVEGQSLRGTPRVVGTSNAADDELSITIDGEAVDTAAADPGLVSEGDGIQTPSGETVTIVATAIVSTWDTTIVADGDHTVTLSAEGPEGIAETTRTVTVDNTAPDITVISPEPDGTYKGEFGVAAEASDTGVGLDTLSATLDGDPLSLPATLHTDDLAEGSHDLVFTATDLLGNRATQTLTFAAVPENPDAIDLVAPAQGATGVATDAELRVTASDPAGDPLTVTFYEAGLTRAGEAVAAWQGAAPTEPPAHLDDATASPLSGDDLAAATSVDGSTLSTSSDEAYPYQRYDLRVPDTSADATALDVEWRGQSLPNRQVSVYAWDFLAGAWASLASGRHPDGADMALTGTLDPAAHVGEGVAHVLVQGRLPDPDGYDFAFAWITDTQYYSESFPEVYDAMNTWIVEQAEERRIAYTLHTGDLVETWNREIEWERASSSMKILDDAGMPYGVVAGNHDNSHGQDHTHYWEHFGEDRFAHLPHYGGSFQNNENHYDLIDAGGAEFVIVHLGFSIAEEEFAWANEVLARHPERNAIVATHEYLSSDGSRTGQGSEIFEQVIVPNDNVFMVLAGHNHGAAYNVKRVGERTVVEMMANYQFARDDQGRRATGYLRVLQFDVAAGTMAVYTYSPYLDDENYFPDDDDEFTLEVDLRPAERLVATDAVWLQNRTGAPIGDPVDIDSGDEAAVAWDALAPDTPHHWYAEATDTYGGRLVSPVWSFTTAARR